MKLSFDEVQKFFETDLTELLNADHNEIEYIKQAHCGDLLIEVYEDDGERLKLWANYDGESIYGVEVEYCGKLNDYVYETVFSLEN